MCQKYSLDLHQQILNQSVVLFHEILRKYLQEFFPSIDLSAVAPGVFLEGLKTLSLFFFLGFLQKFFQCIYDYL